MSRTERCASELPMLAPIQAARIHDVPKIRRITTSTILASGKTTVLKNPMIEEFMTVSSCNASGLLSGEGI